MSEINDAAGNGNGDITPSDSSPEIKDQGKDPSAGGEENNQQDPHKDLPFHEHPRWKDRETEWNKRFEDQKTEFEGRISAAVAEAIAKERPQSGKEGEVKVPSWWGGTDAQYQEFIKDTKDEWMKEAEERSYQRYVNETGGEKKALDDANKWFEDSISKLETEVGKPFDQSMRVELMQTLIERQKTHGDAVDGLQRWNYFFGWDLLQKKKSSDGGKSAADPNRDARRNFAAATTGKDTGKSDDKPQVATNETFANPSNRPW